ncbi:MAG: 2-C-methyl-D-erythritol 4-phosphate cytidylyltransferase [Candidatus Omnitrophota bacterium]
MSIAAIIPAAGFSKRMRGVSKMYLKLGRLPLLGLTLKNISKCKHIGSMVIVVNEKDIRKAKTIIAKYNIKKVKAVVAGGKTRQQSVANGFAAVNGSAKLVLIHDGARPFVDNAVIDRAISAAKKYGAAIAGVPLKPTLKRLSRDGFVWSTLRRDEIWEIQTPQVFKKELFEEAINSSTNSATDDSALIEALGYKVKVVLGSYKNIKVTTPEDLVFAEALSGKGKKE